VTLDRFISEYFGLHRQGIPPSAPNSSSFTRSSLRNETGAEPEDFPKMLLRKWRGTKGSALPTDLFFLYAAVNDWSAYCQQHVFSLLSKYNFISNFDLR
jgi:hypothetical protein